MSETSATLFLGGIFLLGVCFGLLMVAYEDGVAFGFYRRLKCNLGKHTFRVGYKGHVHKYYCVRCKVPRKHPVLAVVDGGKKTWDVGNYKF